MFVGTAKTPEQLEAIALTTYIDELTRRLDNGDLEDPPNPLDLPRPASPPPEYDRFGKRTNTREQRKIHELEVERTLAVIEALRTIPGYVPPASMTKLTKITHKVFFPVRTHPHINFIGLLLGPRGNALRHMENESGAKISIRGRGSVKEGGRQSNNSSSNEDLHCVITAVSQESIEKAQELIEEVVSTAIETPEHKNDFKRLQLRELAELNGTLRDYDNELCGFCRQPGHRKYDCPDRQEIMRKSQCRRCGTMGHFEKDCTTAAEATEAAKNFLDEIETDDLEQPQDSVPPPHRPTPITGGMPPPKPFSWQPPKPSSQPQGIQVNRTVSSASAANTAPDPHKTDATPPPVSKLAPPPQFKLAPPKPFLPPPTKGGFSK